MAATATYTIEVDTDGDGSYATDLTAYVQEAVWGLGMAEPWAPVAAVGSARVVLVNTDKRFSPENTGSPYYDATTGMTALRPRRRVRITADAGSGAVTMWTGMIRALEPTPGVYGERTATLVCEDFMAYLKAERVSIPLQEDIRADEIIEALLDTFVDGSWLLGVAGFSELGVNTYLGGRVFTDTSQLRTGQETFVYAGDDWFGESTTIMSAVRDVCQSEGLGRFFFDRQGRPTFWDRHYQQQQTTVDVTLSADALAGDLRYKWGVDSVYNEVIVKMNPRTEGSANTVLYTHAAEAVRVPGGGSRSVRCPLTDPATGQRVGASAITTPVKGTDYTINTAADGTGEDYTQWNNIIVSVNVKADQVELTFENTATGTLYIRGLQVRGTPLEHYDPTEIAARDGASSTRYGRRTLTVKAPLLTTPSTGYAVARHMLRHRKNPDSLVGLRLLNKNATALGHIVDRSIGDVVRLTETQTALSGVDYYIIGERHTVKAGGTRHQCDWTLEPKGSFQSWLLGTVGYSELGETTYLGV